MRYLDWRQLGVMSLIFLVITGVTAAIYVAIFSYQAETSMWQRLMEGGLAAFTIAVAILGLVAVAGFVIWLARHDKMEGRTPIMLGLVAVAVFIVAIIIGFGWINLTGAVVWPLLMAGPLLVAVALLMAVVIWQINGSPERTESSQPATTRTKKQRPRTDVDVLLAS